MANVVVSLFSLVLLCMAAGAQGRKTLRLGHQWLTSYPVIDDDVDGICKTMVETQGYTCEEHKVRTHATVLLNLLGDDCEGISLIVSVGGRLQLRMATS